jgi:hypothetical protein
MDRSESDLRRRSGPPTLISPPPRADSSRFGQTHLVESGHET